MSMTRNLQLIALMFFGIVMVSQAQVNKIKLVQVPGAFMETSLDLAPGDYQFEIMNKGVDHEVGFVVAPKGKTDAAHHIKEAYVTAPVKNGSSSMTKVVSLDAGEYVYFCPLNPTEQYNLTVKGDMMKKEAMMDKGHTMAKKIKLVQTAGEFKTKSLMLDAGRYQFEIANMGVDHEVGFVLAPKGKTDAANHIKEAYVTAPVKDGSSSMTQVVTLRPGEYVYFCPLNPTAEYSLTVK